jgi:CheY-like chemotaxis protein
MKREIEFEVVSLVEVPTDSSVRPAYDTPLILVVDDEPLVADTIAAVLATSGVKVAKAYNGRAALDMAMLHVPDLLLSDVMMPGMNGIELAMAVVTELPRCKVLLFSGHATMTDLAPAYAEGFDFPLMTKPIHPVEMLNRVFDCLGWEPRPMQAERISAARLPLPISMPAGSLA